VALKRLTLPNTRAQTGRSNTVILRGWVVLPIGNVPKETARMFETANDVTLNIAGDRQPSNSEACS